MSATLKYSRMIKAEARRLGFSDCGIAPAEILFEDRNRLLDWLNKDYHGEMSYMKNNFDIRTDPRRLLNNARSAIMVLQNYYTSEKQQDTSAPIISKYAYGHDYHKIIRKKISKLLEYIQNEITPCNGRVFIDSAPVMEKHLACRAGLGWIGKNSLLVSGKYGSYFFIGGIIVDIELAYNESIIEDFCGDCTLCIDACPTQAIIQPRIIDSGRCISYLTIEYSGNNLPRDFKDKFNNRIYGCDICQEVCPWNKNVRQHNEPELKPNPLILEMTRDEWYHLDEERYNKIFRGSVIKRVKYDKLRRNLEFIRL